MTQSLRKNLRSGLLSSVFYVSVFQVANDIDTDRSSQETLLTDMIANEEIIVSDRETIAYYGNLLQISD